MDERISGYATAILNLAEAEGELSRVESEFLALGQAFDKSADLQIHPHRPPTSRWRRSRRSSTT